MRNDAEHLANLKQKLEALEGQPGNTDKVMAIAGDGAIDIWSGSEHTGISSSAIRSRVTRNDRVFQRHARWSNANAAACSFRSVSRWLIRAALVDSGVTGLRAV